MNDLLTYQRVQQHLIDLVPERPSELRQMEDYALRNDFPIIGPAAGYACYLIARMMGARRVFELGSGYGYSTAWFARAVAENGGGTVDHVVWDEELSRRAQEHLAALGYAGIVRYTVGEAVDVLRAADGPFDLMFNDIDKPGYPASIPVIAEKLRSGGVLLIDNLFRHGQVFDDQDRTEGTAAIRETTRLLTGSPDWVTTILPVRDGVGVALRA